MDDKNTAFMRALMLNYWTAGWLLVAEGSESAFQYRAPNCWHFADMSITRSLGCFVFFLSLSVVTQPPHLNSFHYSLWHFTQPLGVSQSQQQRACFSFHAEATVTSTSVWRATSTDHPGELGDWLLVELHRRLSREKNHHQSSTKTPRRALRPAGFDGSAVLSLLAQPHFVSIQINKSTQSS